MWITVETTVLHDHGAFVGLSYRWIFDEDYTATAIEGLDKNKDGIYDREELAELAKVNIDGLKEYAYFTHAFVAGQKLAMGEARDYWLEHKGGLLALHFTLPFARPGAGRCQGLLLRRPRSGILHRLRVAKARRRQAGCRGAEGMQRSGWPSPRRSQATAPRWGSCRRRWARSPTGLKMISVNAAGPDEAGRPLPMQRDTVYEFLQRSLSHSTVASLRSPASA